MEIVVSATFICFWGTQHYSATKTSGYVPWEFNCIEREKVYITAGSLQIKSAESLEHLSERDFSPF